jgi:predicted RNA methylase
MALKMKKKQLENYLQQLDTLESLGFPRDAWELEQYPTPVTIASEALTNLQLQESAIDGRTIIDLGCGSGILAIGCVLLGAKRVIAVDIDKNCVELTRRNSNDIGIGTDLLEYHVMDVTTLESNPFTSKADAVIMNPPFGTKTREGLDRIFVEKALLMADTVYSFHKTSRREYWMRVAGKELKCSVKPLFHIDFPIEKLIKFHKKTSKDISVDILKFCHSR